MPKLNSKNVENYNQGLGSYGFSGTKLESLGASEYTLVSIAVDVSGSVNGYRKELESCLQEIIKSCKYSPRADNLLVRLVEFSDNLEEIHGFKLLEQCNLSDYEDLLEIKGMTALYDATENTVKATFDYGEELTKNDFDANGILFVLTDGGDNRSKTSPRQIKDAIQEGFKRECLESMTSVLIGIDADPQLDSYLKSFKEDVELNHYVSIGSATSKELAKLAKFVSQSISSQSKSLGTGQAASLTF